MHIIFYEKNRIPVREFIEKLDLQDRAKILACLKSVEELGFECPRVAFRQIRGKLWEIKINAAKTGVRIFYVTIKYEVIVLLHAYKKQTQKAPTKEIAVAEKRMLEVLHYENDYII